MKTKENKILILRNHFKDFFIPELLPLEDKKIKLEFEINVMRTNLKIKEEELETIYKQIEDLVGFNKGE